MNILTEKADIKTLVDSFYKKAVLDPTIGYFFTEVVQLDFEKHMPKMYDFWETTLLHQASYKGNPMQIHKALNDKSSINKIHFEKWLELWIETVDELFEGPLAESAKQRATSIATMMRIKISQK